MLTLTDLIAIAITCKLWSLITDALAIFIVDWKDSRKKRVDNKQLVDIIRHMPDLVEEAHKAIANPPTSVPPPRKRNTVDVNIKMK